MNGDSAAAQAVRGPAIGLIVTGILDGFISVGAAAGEIVRFAFKGRGYYGGFGRAEPIVGLGASVTAALALLFVAGLILIAGMQMSRLRSRELCLVASVLAMIPCTSPCCPVGIPMGLWALLVLNRPEVRAAFR
jgi:hypothetical protein